MIYLHKNLFDEYTNVFASIEDPDEFISEARGEGFGFFKYIWKKIKSLFFGKSEREAYRNISIYSTLGLLLMIGKSAHNTVNDFVGGE